MWISAAAPGVINTPMTVPMAHVPERLGFELTPTSMDRPGRPTESAGVVESLDSASANFNSGHAPVFDGGYALS